jgi:hypothetical protein
MQIDDDVTMEKTQRGIDQYLLILFSFLDTGVFEKKPQ